MLSTRQYLKTLDPAQLRKLFNLCDFTETELKLMIFAYVERRYVTNICDRLHVCKKQYHNLQNIALAKVECKLKEIDTLRH
jgi:hypothetical protein